MNKPESVDGIGSKAWETATRAIIDKRIREHMDAIVILNRARERMDQESP